MKPAVPGEPCREPCGPYPLARMIPSVYQLEARRDHLVPVTAAPDHEPLLLAPVAAAFESMRTAAAEDGIELVAVSGFRSVERQTVIWSRKFIAALGEGLVHKDALAKVLEYSLPPGWSRHHWGTDLDLLPKELGAEARLEVADWSPGQKAYAAGLWLEKRAAEFSFVRAYDIDRGGVKPEPWHWSYAPLARRRLEDCDRVPWKAWFEKRPFLGAELIAADLNRLYDRYVRGIAPELIVPKTDGRAAG